MRKTSQGIRVSISQMRRLLVVVLFNLGSLCLAVAAGAQQDPVRLLQRGCPEVWSEHLVKLVPLELNSLVQERPRAHLSDIQSVEVECTETQVTVTVNATRGSSYARTLPRQVDEEGTVQPRILALTAAELADSIWLVAPTPPKEAPSRPYRRIDPAGRRWVLLAGGSVESIGKPSLLALGAALALERHLFGVLTIRSEVRAMIASSKQDAAKVRTRELSGVIAALVGEHAHDRTQRWSWGFGPGVRVGWAQIVGIPTEPPQSCPPPGCDLAGDDLRGLFLGPLLTARLALVLPEAVVFAATLEGGLVTRPLIGTDASGAALFGYDGPWLGGGLEIGTAF